MTRKLLLAAVLICLGGCTMIPKYTRPEAPVPAAWPSGPAYKETAATEKAPASRRPAMAAILHRRTAAKNHRHGLEKQP